MYSATRSASKNKFRQVAPKPLSEYAVRMTQLKAKIFGEPSIPHSSCNLKIVRSLQKMPVEVDKWRVDYYPPHPMFNMLMKLLRMHGLYRDEHMDFREEFARMRALRGKVPPKPGEGKRAKLKNKAAA